jgi:hypothetical protein
VTLTELDPIVTVWKFRQRGRRRRLRNMRQSDAKRFCALPSSKGPGWFYGWMTYEES